MIDIIVPTYNRHEAISRLINDLKLQRNKNFNLYIIDQSKDPYKNEIKTDFKVKVLWTPEFKSPILARDYGSKIAKSDVMIFIDDDMIPKNDLVHNVNKIFRQYDGPLVIGGVCNVRKQGKLESFLRKILQKGIYNDPRYEYFRNAYFGNYHLLDSFLPTFYISASIMAINKKSLNINPFPVHFKRHISDFLSYLLTAEEIEDKEFKFKSVKSFRKIFLTFHSAYHLLILSGINTKNLFHFFLRSTLICIFSIRTLLKKFI